MTKTIINNYNTEDSGPYLVKVTTVLNEQEVYRHTSVDYEMLNHRLVNLEIEKYSIELDSDPQWD